MQLNQWLIHWQMPFLLGDHILPPDRYFYWDPPDYYGKPELTRPCRFVDVTHLLLESVDLEQ